VNDDRMAERIRELKEQTKQIESTLQVIRCRILELRALLSKPSTHETDENGHE